MLAQCGGWHINLFGHRNHVLSAAVVTVGEHRRVGVCVRKSVLIDVSGIVNRHMAGVATGERRRVLVRSGLGMGRAFALVVAQGVWIVLVPVAFFQVRGPAMWFGTGFFLGIRIRHGQQHKRGVVIHLWHGMVVRRHQQTLHCA